MAGPPQIRGYGSVHNNGFSPPQRIVAVRSARTSAALLCKSQAGWQSFFTVFVLFLEKR